MQTHQTLQPNIQRPFLTSSPTISGTSRNDNQTPLIAAAVLPAQFCGQSKDAAHKSGLGALMLAVLTDALECYQQQFQPSNRRDPRLVKEAEAWLFSNDEKWPFAFVNVCAALGMEPEYIRRGLRRARQSSPAVTRQKLRQTAAVRRVPHIAA